MKKRLSKLISLIISAAMIITTISSVTIPVSAADVDKEATTTVINNASDVINATDDNIKKQSGDHNGEVRMTPVATATPDATSNDYGAKIGVFKLGKISIGSSVTVTVQLWTANNDLNGVGLYTTESEVTAVVDQDYKEVMAGHELSPLGTIGTPSNNAKIINDKTLSKSTFNGVDSVTAGVGKLSLDTDPSKISYTADITEENDGYLYFIAGGWNGENRLLQVKDITVEYSSTLADTVEYAPAGGEVKLNKDVSLSERLKIEKNLRSKRTQQKPLQVLTIKEF